MYQRTR